LFSRGACPPPPKKPTLTLDKTFSPPVRPFFLRPSPQSRLCPPPLPTAANQQCTRTTGFCLSHSVCVSTPNENFHFPKWSPPISKTSQPKVAYSTSVLFTPLLEPAVKVFLFRPPPPPFKVSLALRTDRLRLLSGSMENLVFPRGLEGLSALIFLLVVPFPRVWRLFGKRVGFLPWRLFPRNNGEDL